MALKRSLTAQPERLLRELPSYAPAARLYAVQDGEAGGSGEEMSVIDQGAMTRWSALNIFRQFSPRHRDGSQVDFGLDVLRAIRFLVGFRR